MGLRRHRVHLDGGTAGVTARRRLRPTEETLAVGGVTLNVAVGGTPDGHPLLLLHGLAARWQAFGPLLPGLTSTWRVIAPDFRGHGCSAHAPGTYRLPTFVADTREVIDHYLDGVPPVVYGHSLGGWVGLWIAAAAPVRALVVGDTAIDPGNIAPDAAVNYLADLPLALKSLSTALQQMDPAVMESFRADLLTAGYEPRDLLPKVACPVLLLQADPDAGGLMTDADVDLATRCLPDVRHVRFDGLGHGLHVQDAHKVLDTLEPFLAEV